MIFMPQTCAQCVMDSTVPDIIFLDDGTCNYCKAFLCLLKTIDPADLEVRRKNLFDLVDQIKKDGSGKQYDCIVGVSGGVDSAWVLYQAKQLGLRPLAVHMDNGWNSELAQNNIEKLVKKLDIHLYTHVINWHEYRELMQAFFDADVVDVELLYDNAMYAVNYRLAKQHKIKWILAGTNKSTEGMRMPPGWNWFKFDAHNIRRIGARNGVKRLTTFPAIGSLDFVWFTFVRKIKWVSFLDFFDYKKDEALSVLEKECEYKRYPYKHYESIFTRFYQGYILPKKFGIDKRKLHLSTLVVGNQMKREEALKLLCEIPYPNVNVLNEDIDYFLKKMQWTHAQLESYLDRQEVSHSVYGSEMWLWNMFLGINRLKRSILKKARLR